jgi:hypothetical protein
MTHFEPPIHWADHEDIAQKLYERFGDEFNEGKIYRIRFTISLNGYCKSRISKARRKRVQKDTSK